MFTYYHNRRSKADLFMDGLLYEAYAWVCKPGAISTCGSRPPVEWKVYWTAIKNLMKGILVADDPAKPSRLWRRNETWTPHEA